MEQFDTGAWSAKKKKCLDLSRIHDKLDSQELDSFVLHHEFKIKMNYSEI